MNNLNHIAIIMDGNGRWAKSRGLLRLQGHIAGAKNIEKMAEAVFSNDIKYLSLYAFSTENWNRPKDEVDGLLNLLNKYLVDIIKNNKNKNIKYRFVGNRYNLDRNIIDLIDKVESVNPDASYQLNICFNYGGKAEIIDAVNSLIKQGKKEITEEDITNNIYTGVFPPPDMIIRTGKEKRLSNFFLWQGAYSELFFTDTLWPDFNEKEINSMIKEYYTRDRRFGEIK